jgi:hypothetical protein
VATLPGPYEIKVTYPGGFGFGSSWSAAPFTINRATTALEFTVPDPTIGAGDPNPLTALLTDGQGSPITERTVLFVLEGGSTSLVRPVITDYAGRARLGSVDLGTGSYTVAAHFASVVDNLPGTTDSVDLTDPRYLPASATTSLTVDADPPV